MPFSLSRIINTIGSVARGVSNVARGYQRGGILGAISSAGSSARGISRAVAAPISRAGSVAVAPVPASSVTTNPTGAPPTMPTSSNIIASYGNYDVVRRNGHPLSFAGALAPVARAALPAVVTASVPALARGGGQLIRAVGRRVNRSTIGRLIRAVGPAAAGTALGLSLDELAQMQATSPARRSRGISARDLRRTRRTLRKFSRFNCMIKEACSDVRKPCSCKK